MQGRLKNLSLNLANPCPLATSALDGSIHRQGNLTRPLARHKSKQTRALHSFYLLLAQLYGLTQIYCANVAKQHSYKSCALVN